MQLRANDLNEMEQVAKTLARQLEGLHVVALDGEMGAGKTTLVKFICSALGVVDEVSSPTFSLVNEYLTSSGKVIYHFDLYRLETPEEALDFGIEEYLESGNLCLIEWPEKLGSFLPEGASRIKMKDNDGVREIFFQP